MTKGLYYKIIYIDGFAQNCSDSIANAVELLQSCIKPSIWTTQRQHITIVDIFVMIYS